MRNEKDVKRKIKHILGKHGWFWWSTQTSAFGKSGISDIHALKWGVFIAIETKFLPNTPSHMQKGFLQSVNAEDAFGFIVHQNNWEDLDTFLTVFAETTTLRQKGEKPSTEQGSTMLNMIASLTEEITREPGTKRKGPSGADPTSGGGAEALN